MDVGVLGACLLLGCAGQDLHEDNDASFALRTPRVSDNCEQGNHRSECDSTNADAGSRSEPNAGGFPVSDAGALGSTALGLTSTYTLTVDSPTNNSTVQGVVTVRGKAPGFLNVEVWDATHTKPPLAQVKPDATGAFSTTVSTAGLASGATTWTVRAWDSLPGMPFTHSAKVDLALTITNPQQTIGTGDTAYPAKGPAPVDAAKVGGAPFVLVKNWDFGKGGTIRGVTDLINEFQFHDQGNTIANGTNYGAVIVAPTAATAIPAYNLGLPNNMQPVEDPARPNREFTDTSMLAHVRPLKATQTSASVSAHNAGNGSVEAKWTLPKGGALLGKDILWETRVRMPKPAAGYWYALWTVGNKWYHGAEMDVIETFGAPNIYPACNAFHVNSVGGTDSISYSSWPNGLTTAGVPTSDRDLTQYHTFTWVYAKDNTYKVYYDGYLVQSGTINWTLGATSGGTPVDVAFLFDFTWGHTQIPAVNISLPASSFPITYEIDYSRVYLR